MIYVYIYISMQSYYSLYGFQGTNYNICIHLPYTVPFVTWEWKNILHSYTS